ncbi:MAG TPA: hypothetical protein VFC39_09585, partial [Acidobacteriaceae bacterium]|nr:hypothetical protein [Acidobacteriaceae bacterium]
LGFSPDITDHHKSGLYRLRKNSVSGKPASVGSPTSEPFEFLDTLPCPDWFPITPFWTFMEFFRSLFSPWGMLSSTAALHQRKRGHLLGTHLFQRAFQQLPCGRQTQMLLSPVATEGHAMDVAGLLIAD